jgi:hypothetical protein
MSDEERKANAEIKMDQKAKKDQQERIKKNEKIRCPNCKKNKYYDQYLVQKDLGVLVCSVCGVLFIDQHKIKIIKRNIQKEKQGAVVTPPPKAEDIGQSPIITKG